MRVQEIALTFTSQELSQIEEFLATYDKPNIPFQVFGVTKDFDTYSRDFLKAFLASEVGTSTPGSVHKTKLVFQHDVSVENLHKVYQHLHTLTLPEFVTLPGDEFWINEGHHRTMLQLIAGRSEIKGLIEYSEFQHWQP